MYSLKLRVSFLIAFLPFLTFHLFSQPYQETIDSICGNISSDSIWGPDTVYVGCNLTLDDNVTLTILPGTYIEFEDSVSFEVIGTIKAIGTESQPITFTAKNAETGWQGIQYKNGSYATTHPEGVMNDNDSSLFVHCNFEQCTNDVFFIDKFSNIKISESGFRFNKLSVIFIVTASPLIIRNQFSNNITAHGNIIWCAQGSNPLISGNLIANNKCSIGGGFITGSILVCQSHSNPLIVNNVITLNQSEWGTLHCEQSSPRIINNTISGNISTYGGGIYCSFSHPEIINTILWNNVATKAGNQLYATMNSPQLQRCIIGNKDNDIFLNDATVQYNEIYSIDPQFNDPISDFQLSSRSPCINTGIKVVGDADLPSFDVLGNPRIADSLIDIGAYEFQGIADEIAPLDLFINRRTIAENSPLDTVAGIFTVLDPNRNETHTYELISVDGTETDNEDFYISGDTLKSATIPDFETKPQYSILVQVTDNTGKSLIKSINISVYDLVEKPLLINPIRDTVIYLQTYFTFKIPDNTFSKDHNGSFYFYNAHLDDNTDILPDWLQYNSNLRIFNGTPTEPHSYNIVVTVRNFQFTSDPDTFQIRVIENPVSAVGEKLWDEISIYPNPGNGKFYITPCLEGEMQLTVYDAFGGTILKDQLLPKEAHSQFDLSENPDGLYILKLCQNNRCKTIKLIKGTRD
jgi:hypothetical protein